MNLITVVIILVVVGIALWFLRTKLTMDPLIKNIIYFVVIAAVLLWLLGLYGLLPDLGALRVGR